MVKEKCKKCKKPIDKGEEYECDTCGTAPFHENCTDDDGHCPNCHDSNISDTRYCVRVITDNDETDTRKTFTKTRAMKDVLRMQRVIDAGKKTVLDADGDMYMTRNIGIITVREE